MAALRKSSVLLVESHLFVAMAVEDQLNDAGFGSVKVASSCREATDYLERHTPDVVILDTELADGSATEIARALVSRRIPFVVHSGGWLASSDRRPPFDTGRWLSKPCRPGELAVSVKDCLLSA
ncbi:response regulator [Rhizobium tubonense]|uniref:Response regulator n=1 Tax=Rhizobium tubonense TaxID=484088 RepID=A0A2W4CU45_9HYPH|nr:response regulator [Rhizobium tubonense]PZM15919.1 response regulator [Rhizobium tubonense]